CCRGWYLRLSKTNKGVAMRCRSAGIVALMATALLSGCGTVANMQETSGITPPGGRGEPSRVYGGVQSDFSAIQASVQQVSNGEQDSVARLLIWALDVPLSLIGDTVTLPYILAHQPDPALKSGQPNPSTG